MSTCSPRYRVRDNQHWFRSNRQWHTLFFFASRSELVASERSSLIPTASAVRYYTVTQSLLWLLCFPLSCQRSCCASCWGCAVETDPKSTRRSLFLLIDLIDCTILPSIASLCRWALNALLFGLCMELRRNRSPAQHSCVIFFCCCFSLVLSIVSNSRRIDRFNQYNVGWTFNSESYID